MKRFSILLGVFTFFVFYAFICLCVYAQNPVEQKASRGSKKEKLDFYLSAGDEHLLRSEYGPAIESYNIADDVDRKNPQVHLRLGEAYRLADMQESAIRSYNKAIRFGSKDVRVYLGLAMVYKSQFLYEKSEEYYRKALELEKENTLALTGLADICSLQGKYPEAIEIYKRVLSKNPTDDVKLRLAILNFLTDNLGGVQDYSSPLADYKILNGYIELNKNPDKAIEDFKSADEYFLRAITYLKKREFTAAKKSFETVISGEQNTLCNNLATILIKRIK